MHEWDWIFVVVVSFMIVFGMETVATDGALRAMASGNSIVMTKSICEDGVCGCCCCCWYGMVEFWGVEHVWPLIGYGLI